MASVGGLDCAVCFKPLTDPYFIPCGHNFCRPCLEMIENNARGISEDSDSDDDENSRGPRCPQCRAGARSSWLMSSWAAATCNIIEECCFLFTSVFGETTNRGEF